MAVREILEQARVKRLRVQRLEEAFADSLERAASTPSLATTEKVQTSSKSTLDATLAALDDQRDRLEEARKEAEELTEQAKAMINLIREDETAWTILWNRYILCYGWRKIARAVHYSRVSCWRLAADGVTEIEKMKHHETS